MQDLAFISPCFHDEYYGGVQYTARMALEAIGNNAGINRKILCYGPRCRRNSGAPTHVCCHSKSRSIMHALTLRSGTGRLLFWHLDLLKLLPFTGARGKRVFLFLHGIECWRQFSGSACRLLNRVDVFLTNSDFTWKRFVEMNPQYKTAAHRTVPLGVGSPADRVESPGEIPVAAIIARMNRSEGYKGHAELIQAWPGVRTRISAAELWVIGGGDGMADLKQLASTLGVGNQVRFFGVVSDEDKQKLLQQSRCLAMPSRGEGFGLVYLEAMRIGRPCLSSLADAGQEVIDPPRAGVAVDPADSDRLAEAVAELLTPGAAWDLRSSAARSMYEEKFTAAHFQRRLLAAISAEAAS